MYFADRSVLEGLYQPNVGMARLAQDGVRLDQETLPL